MKKLQATGLQDGGQPATESLISRPEIIEPQRTKPQVTQLQVAKLPTTEPKLPKPQVTQPQVTTIQTPKEESITGWEFKTVRAKSSIFQNPAIFRRLCQEESKKGWILLEKLDDRRVRFKRSGTPSNSTKPSKQAVDPYRTQFNLSPNRARLFWSVAFLTALILPAYLAYRLVSSSLAPPKLPPAYYPEPTAAPPSLSNP